MTLSILTVLVRLIMCVFLPAAVAFRDFRNRVNNAHLLSQSELLLQAVPLAALVAYWCHDPFHVWSIMAASIKSAMKPVRGPVLYTCQWPVIVV